MSNPLVLCYHAVSDEWASPFAVTTGGLEAQLSALQRRGYRPSTFGQAFAQPSGSRTFVVTFDDAYRSVVERAFPVMERLGVPGTVFACTGFVGSDTPMPLDLDDYPGGAPRDELQGASWAELEHLVAAGWEVGSHTRSHQHLTTLGDAELAEELGASRAECEYRLGVPCPSVAYPFGDVDDRVAGAARAAGYEQGGAVLGVGQPSGRLQWPRVRVKRNDVGLRFRLKRSPVLRKLRGASARVLHR